MGRVDLFLCGDVMTGRGVDQILAHPSEPEIYESYLRDARRYVALVEQTSGPIARPADFSYVWGDALDELRRAAPDARIVNLETSVTRSAEPWPGKGIHYRMHPRNVPCLTAAKIDVCVLANNHVLDWGREGLVETLDTLHRAGLKTAGAGRSAAEAEAVAVVELGGERRVLVVGVAEPSSGVPSSWEARKGRPGVALIEALDEAQADAIGARLDRVRRPGDVAVASIHWGDNWGYEAPAEHVRFAHALVDRGVDVVHGHSSHHPRPIELYRGKPILYGCGDLINDYEGIGGHEEFRDELRLLYFVGFDQAALAGLRMTPMRIRKMRLERASRPDALWLKETLARVSAPYGTAIDLAEDGSLVASGAPSGPRL
jgi:poly-gamma-glutamate capsule biosynthesis protein CapA/YwtB (metallophosphatase superfamily)